MLYYNYVTFYITEYKLICLIYNSVSTGDGEEEQELTPEEDLIQEIEIPENLRPRDHINQLLKLDEENEEKERAIQREADIILRDLKRLYDNAIKPLETMYKYRDLSNRHFGGERAIILKLIVFPYRSIHSLQTSRQDKCIFKFAFANINL